jgi:hypothetical protein
MKTLALMAICFVLSISFSISQDFDYSFTEKYKVSTPAQLSVSSSDGNIEVNPSKGGETEVFYIARKNGKLLKIDRKELEQEVILEVSQSGNQLTISVRHKENFSSWNNNQVNVSFKIFAPSETAGTLHTSDGNITLAGLNGDQECKTSDGNIGISDIKGRVTGVTSDGNTKLSGITGDVFTKTSDGNIDLTRITGSVESSTSDGNINLNNITGEVKSSTSDGSIRLESVIGGVSAKTSDGQISFKDLSGSLSAITSNGDIRGNLVKLSGQLIVKTSDGNIDVTVPGKMGLDLDIRGESLNVPLDNFSGKSEEKSIIGKSNGGGIKVNLEASDGNVTLAFH